MKCPLSFALAIAAPLAAGAFVVGSGGSGGPFLARRPASSALLSSPGGWENDDFLGSLGGDGGGDNEGYYDQQGEPVERIVPPNDLTDEEITTMAMRSAQFYNTDTSLEEAYGTPRQGPPRKQEEEEYGDFQ